MKKIKDEMREDILDEMRNEVKEGAKMIGESFKMLLILIFLWVFISPLKIPFVNEIISFLAISLVTNFLLLTIEQVIFRKKWEDPFNQDYGKVRMVSLVTLILVLAFSAYQKWHNKQDVTFELSIMFGFIQYLYLKKDTLNVNFRRKE